MKKLTDFLLEGMAYFLILIMLIIAVFGVACWLLLEGFRKGLQKVSSK
jgi:hypothetical protein